MSACPDTWSLSLCSPQKKKWAEDLCARYVTRDIKTLGESLVFNDNMWGFCAPYADIMVIHLST
jgi:hypothetical protein